MYLMMQLSDLGAIASFDDDLKFTISPQVYEFLQKKLGEAAEKEQIVQFIFKDVAQGLLYLHETMKFANRDIKPDNILFTT